MKTTVQRCFWFAMAAVLLSAAQAQRVTPSQSDRATSNVTDEEPIKLSPFVVSTDKDNGYIAADTLNAGRLRTNLLMTPADMEVFTRDLLDDLGIANIDEASAWLTSSHPLELSGINSNVMNPNNMGMADPGNNVDLRGMKTQPSTRNYFLSATTPKEYNVQRIESGRGPNATLFGEGGLGGGVNYITKQAEHRAFATVRLRTDTASSKGVALDINRPITANLDLRYNFSALDQRHPIIAGMSTKSLGNALSATYRPWERTRINIDVDFTQTERPSFVMTSFLDKYSSWNEVPVTTKLTGAQAKAAGLTLQSGPHFWTYVEGLGMLDLAGTAITEGSDVALVVAVPLGIADGPEPDESFSAKPNGLNARDKTVDLQASVDHSFRNGLALQLAGQYAKYRTEGAAYAFQTAFKDPNAYLPDGRPNPNYGKTFSSGDYGRMFDGTYRDSKTVRLVATYPIKALGGTTNLSVFGHHQESNSRTVYWDPRIVDPNSTLPITHNSTKIQIYRYWDNLTPDLPDFSELFDLRMVPTLDGSTKKKNDAFQVAASGNYLKGRLSYVAGFRRDKSTLTNINGVQASRDPVTGAYGTYEVEDLVAFKNTKTFGAVYFPWERIGGYANYSEGFLIETNSNLKLDGTFAHANIVPAKAESLGLRFRIAKTDKMTIVGSAGFYQAEQSNSAIGINVGRINKLWANHDMPERYIETFSSSPASTASANSIQSTRSFSGKGWEGNLTLNVGNALRLVANAAFPRTRQFAMAADYRAYVAANMPQWSQWAADPANPTRTSDADSVQSIQNGIDGFQDEREQNGTYKYRYNATGVYTVQKGALRRLRIGGGVQFYGPRLVANEIDRPYDYVYASSYYLLSGSLGYPINLKRARLDLQVNVNNLLDYDEPMFQGMNVYEDTLIPRGFRRVNPRELRLTSTLRF